VRVLVPSLKRILFPVVSLIISLAVPFKVYGTNGRFDISSILFGASYDSSIGSLSVHFILDSSYLLPSLLLCAPCFLWLYIERDLSLPTLLGSVGVVLLSLTQILLLFLPPWAVFSCSYVVIAAIVPAVVPEFINLVPYAGLVLTVMVLLPMLWRVFMYPRAAGIGFGKKAAAVMSSLSGLLFPATIETYSWRDTNFNQYFFEGYSFESSTWSLSSRVDGNVWGQNSWFNFSVSSIYSSLTLLLLMLPAIAFLWFVCRSPTERREIVIMVAAGLTYFLVVSLTCIWLNYTSSAPGNWTVTLFPALLIIGVMVLVIEYGYRWMTMKRSVRIRVSEDESLSEHVCDLARSQSSCKVLA